MISIEIRKSHKSKDRPYYFVIFISNGKLVSTSKMYRTKQEVEYEVHLLKKQAATAKIIDTTTSWKARLLFEAAHDIAID
ncbi:DUF1508 domain-containing protein [Klebsiella variicola]|uniref:DUF1508 domain-containing protein n=1 Tax=Klebsiella variicola TaxID=244366 RepID=UPI0009BC5285|nr:DUF1508 domain-containing protein [Klebsiella variicola]SLY44894.1 Domain of uncharacterised function (DUF1508) [Klebsiella variicola]